MQCFNLCRNLFFDFPPILLGGLISCTHLSIKTKASWLPRQYFLFLTVYTAYHQPTEASSHASVFQFADPFLCFKNLDIMFLLFFQDIKYESFDSILSRNSTYLH